MAILKNKIGLEGKETTPIAISTEFWQQLITAERVVEDKKADITPSYDLNRVTNTDLDTMVILHKICNTNGLIKETTVHQIYQKVCSYFESPPSKTQFYISMEKFTKKEYVFVNKNEITGLYTYKLNHFKNRETGVLHRYGIVTEVVFTSRFSNLSLAARKAFFMTAIRQENQPFIFQGLNGENGLYKIFKKNQPNQIREVFKELTSHAGDKPAFFAVAKLEKYRGKYHKAYMGLNAAYKVKASDDQQFRDPIEAPVRYPRKSQFIERVLVELGIAELKEQMALLVNCLKNMGFRVIRQVLRQIKSFVTKNGHFPRDLAYQVMKETRIQRDCEIRDIAHEVGIFKFIAPGKSDVERENRLFEFSNAFSRYSTEHIKKMFKSMKSAIVEKFSDYIMPDFNDYCFENELATIEDIIYTRADAYRRRIDVNLYREMENHAIRFEMEKGEEHVCEWLHSRIQREKPIRPPADINKLKIEEFILKNSPYSPKFQVI